MQRPWVEAPKALRTSHRRRQRGEPTSEQEDQLLQRDRASTFVVDCVKFPHIEFDHHAIFGCCFSLVLCAPCRRSQQFLGRRGRPRVTGAWLTPRNTLRCHMCCLPNLVAMQSVGMVQKYGDAGALEMADP